MEFIFGDQLDIYDWMSADYKINKPIRLIELFAGVGSQAMALRDIGAKFEHYKVVEFDKYAIASYNAIHGTNFPTIDITELKGEDLEITDKDKYCYIMTYSFPCTDLSAAGKMAGMEEGSGTRSSLLWEVRRLLEETEELPQVLVMENVPRIHAKQNMPAFQRWLDYLDQKGYSTYWQDMNAKEYGVAQSRNRTIAVSILGPHVYRFPKPYPLDKVMKDYLEDEVDEKYYLTSDKAKDMIDKLIVNGKILTDRQLTYATNTQPQSNCATQSQADMALESANTSTNTVACVRLDGLLGNHQAGSVYDKQGICPTLMAGMDHGNTMPYIVEVNNEQ